MVPETEEVTDPGREEDVPPDSGITIPTNILKPLLLPFIGFLLGSGTTSGLWAVTAPQQPVDPATISKLEGQITALSDEVRALRLEVTANRWTRSDHTDFIRQDFRPAIRDLERRLESIERRPYP